MARQRDDGGAGERYVSCIFHLPFLFSLLLHIFLLFIIISYNKTKRDPFNRLICLEIVSAVIIIIIIIII
jgi:hypothetical protein